MSFSHEWRETRGKMQTSRNQAFCYCTAVQCSSVLFCMKFCHPTLNYKALNYISVTGSGDSKCWLHLYDWLSKCLRSGRNSLLAMVTTQGNPSTSFQHPWEQINKIPFIWSPKMGKINLWQQKPESGLWEGVKSRIEWKGVWGKFLGWCECPVSHFGWLLHGTYNCWYS